MVKQRLSRDGALDQHAKGQVKTNREDLTRKTQVNGAIAVVDIDSRHNVIPHLSRGQAVAELEGGPPLALALTTRPADTSWSVGLVGGLADVAASICVCRRVVVIPVQVRLVLFGERDPRLTSEPRRCNAAIFSEIVRLRTRTIRRNLLPARCRSVS